MATQLMSSTSGNHSSQWRRRVDRGPSKIISLLAFPPNPTCQTSLGTPLFRGRFLRVALDLGIRSGWAGAGRIRIAGGSSIVGAR